MKAFIRLCVALIVAASLGACGGGGAAEGAASSTPAIANADCIWDATAWDESNWAG